MGWVGYGMDSASTRCGVTTSISYWARSRVTTVLFDARPSAPLCFVYILAAARVRAESGVEQRCVSAASARMLKTMPVCPLATDSFEQIMNEVWRINSKSSDIHLARTTIKHT